MNIRDSHTTAKGVSTKSIFSSDKGKAISIRILKGEILKEHITPIPAMLLCITGKAVFENENGLKETLTPGDYTLIDPQILHWVEGIETSELVLVK